MAKRVLFFAYNFAFVSLMYRFTFVHRSRQMLHSKQKLENSLRATNGNDKNFQIPRYNLKSVNPLIAKNKVTQNLKISNGTTTQQSQQQRTLSFRTRSGIYRKSSAGHIKLFNYSTVQLFNCRFVVLASAVKQSSRSSLIFIY